MPRSNYLRQRTALVLGIATLAAVTGCSSNSSGGGNKPNNSASLGTPDKATGTPIKIGLVGDGASNGVDNTGSTNAAQAVVKYANAYLGGINGHVIQVDQCLTQDTPSGGTACGVQLAKDKVAVADVPVSAQDSAVLAPLSSAKIPYFSYTSAAATPLTSPGSYVLTDPIASISATANIAKQKGLAKVGMLVINVPAATGPIKTIAVPAFQKAGVTLDFEPISPSVADMTPQIQQGISKGDKMFSVVGTDAFVVTAMKGLRQLGFKGLIQTSVSSPSASDVAAVPGGFAGNISVTTLSTSATDPDVKLLHAIMSTYAPSSTIDSSSYIGYAGTLGLIKALEGHPDATTPAAIIKTLNTMPKPIPLPLGDGVTFQCGQKVEALTPAVCNNKVLTAVMDKNGNLSNFQTLG